MQVNYDKLWKLMIDKKINKTQLSEKQVLQQMLWLSLEEMNRYK